MWKKLQIPSQRSGSRPRANCPFRPRLEVLEDREVPAVITVNNPTDTIIAGQVNLRQAITMANLAGTGDDINIAVSGTDTLGSNMTPVTATNTTINVVAGNTFAVSGAGMFQDFSVGSMGQVVVNGNNALTFRDGFAPMGGGIMNAGRLTLDGTTVTGNTASAIAGPNSAIGGGIFNGMNAALILSNDTVVGNAAVVIGAGTGTAEGGGIANAAGGVVSGTNVNVSGNVAQTMASGGSLGFGGGISDRGAAFALSGSVVSGNTAITAGSAIGTDAVAAVGGGGIGMTGDPAFVLSGVTITANRVQYESSGMTMGNSIAGGGLYTNGTATVIDSTISNNLDNSAGNGENAGGGVFNRGVLTLTNSTVAFNSVTNATAGAMGATDTAFDGGVSDIRGGVLMATNDTIWANSASAMGAGATATGGGLGVGGDSLATLINVTVVNNTVTGNVAGSSGGGIRDGGNLGLVNTIVFNPVNPGGAVDSPDVFTDMGAGLAEQNSNIASTLGFTITPGNDLGGNINGVTPSLGPLAANGGPTLTVAELAGSPTINAGTTSSPLGAVPTTDQRGVARSNPPDMGAFDTQTTPTPPPMPTPPSTAATTIINLNVSESFGLFGGQMETVKGQVVSPGGAVSGGSVTIIDAGQSQTVGVDAAGNFTATFSFNLFQEFTTARAHTIMVSYGGATVGTTTFTASAANVNSPDSTFNFIFQILLLQSFFMQSGGM
jgi:hypothetical protein